MSLPNTLIHPHVGRTCSVNSNTMPYTDDSMRWLLRPRKMEQKPKRQRSLETRTSTSMVARVNTQVMRDRTFEKRHDDPAPLRSSRTSYPGPRDRRAARGPPATGHRPRPPGKMPSTCHPGESTATFLYLFTRNRSFETVHFFFSLSPLVPVVHGSDTGPNLAYSADTWRLPVRPVAVEIWTLKM
jgi:hypothetical protein